MRAILLVRVLFFYCFLLLNLLNFQYVPGFRTLNNFLTSIRIFLLRMSGAKIGKSSILRPGSTVLSANKLTIGSNTVVGPGARIMNFVDVIIGNDVEIGPNIIIQTNEHLIEKYDEPLGKQGGKFSSIEIGDGCYIGGDVTILSGVKIKNNCLIGAKSLVNKDLEISGLYAGCPAKLIKIFT